MYFSWRIVLQHSHKIGEIYSGPGYFFLDVLSTIDSRGEKTSYWLVRQVNISGKRS